MVFHEWYTHNRSISLTSSISAGPRVEAQQCIPIPEVSRDWEYLECRVSGDTIVCYFVTRAAIYGYPGLFTPAHVLLRRDQFLSWGALRHTIPYIAH